MSEPIIDLSSLPLPDQEVSLRAVQAHPQAIRPLAVKAMPGPLVAVFGSRDMAWIQGFTLISTFPRAGS